MCDTWVIFIPTFRNYVPGFINLLSIPLWRLQNVI